MLPRQVSCIAVFFRGAAFAVGGLRASLTALPAWNRTTKPRVSQAGQISHLHACAVLVEQPGHLVRHRDEGAADIGEAKAPATVSFSLPLPFPGPRARARARCPAAVVNGLGAHSHALQRALRRFMRGRRAGILRDQLYNGRPKRSISGNPGNPRLSRPSARRQR
jgi:hypothetical protein